MVAIVAFVAITQISVVTQAVQLYATQKGILQHSVPLFERSHEFARFMTVALGQTTRVNSAIPIEELNALQAEYKSNKEQAYEALASIEKSFNGGVRIDSLHSSLATLTKTSTQLFEAEFSLRALEEETNLKALVILGLTNQLKDSIGRSLTVSTTRILSTSGQLGAKAELNDVLLAKFLKFASETEVLHTLNSHVVGIAGLINGDLNNVGRRHPDFASRLGFQIRAATQTLPLLNDIAVRRQFASLISELNRVVTSKDGYFALRERIAQSRQDHDQLNLDMISTVAAVDSDVREIVTAAATTFRADIGVSTQLTRVIVWISVITSCLLGIGMAFANRKLIQEQISNRFTTLTQDVLAISNGDYEHKVRVTGEDELGDIAQALDTFKKQAAELARSNLELERFAYVAAHDLKSPLDAIQDLAKWTLEDADDELSKDSRNNLELLIKRSSRLSVLQSDLLKYAQANSVNDGIALLDVGVEIARIADLLDPTNSYQIEFIGGPCEITCHCIPFRQILLNLITNAIKHHDRDEGKVVITCASMNGMLRTAIQDDGAGIEPQYQRKIFELFKTLRSRDRVEGSGLGLALVSKLVGRFGGSVAVQSDAPNTRGTTFTFELPDMADASRVKKAA